MNESQISGNDNNEDTVEAIQKRLKAVIAASSFDEAREALDLPSLQEEALKRYTEVSKTAQKKLSQIGVTFRFFSSEYLSRLFVSIVFFMFGAYLSTLASVIAGYRTPHVQILDVEGGLKKQKILPDIGHDLLRVLGTALFNIDDFFINWFSLPDHLLQCCVVCAFVFVWVHPRRFLIIRRMLVVVAGLYCLRSCTVLVTSLPDPSPTCQAQFSDPTGTGAYKRHAMFPTVFYRALTVAMSPSNHVTCGDMVFSGHTMLFMLCAGIFHTYCRPRQFHFLLSRTSCHLMRRTVYLVCSCGLVAIIGTRLHYTLDVVISVVITSSAWNTYHRLAMIGVLKRHYILLSWLEAEEVLQVDRLAHHAMRLAVGDKRPLKDKSEKRLRRTDSMSSDEIDSLHLSPEELRRLTEQLDDESAIVHEHRESKSSKKRKKRKRNKSKQQQQKQQLEQPLSPVSGVSREVQEAMDEFHDMGVRENAVALDMGFTDEAGRRVQKRVALAGLCCAVVCYPFVVNHNVLYESRFRDVYEEYLSPVMARVPPAEHIKAQVESFLVDWGVELPSLNFTEDATRPGLLAAEEGLIPKHPVIMLPGLVTSGLEMWKGKECIRPESNFRRRIWGSLSMAEFVARNLSCWMEHMSLDPQTGDDPEDISLHPVSGFEAADFFVPGFYVWAHMIENLADVGYGPENMVLMPYDWRKPFHHHTKHFYIRLRSVIETMVDVFDEKVVLISHSMGGLVWLHFSNYMESLQPGWVDKHTESIVAIASPWLGLPKTVSTLISSEMKDTADIDPVLSHVLHRVLSVKQRLSMFHSWGSLPSMLPKGGDRVWGKVTPSTMSTSGAPDGGANFMIAVNRSLSEALDVLSLDKSLELLWEVLPDGIAESYKEWYSYGFSRQPPAQPTPSQWANPLESRLPHAPGMSMYCLYGVGKSTERSYHYRDREPSEENPVPLELDTDVNFPVGSVNRGVQSSDGDGTVPLVSMGYPCVSTWKRESHNPGNARVVTKEYEHVLPQGMRLSLQSGPGSADHVDIMGNHQLIHDVLRVATGHGSEVHDVLISDIEEVADRIDQS